MRPAIAIGDPFNTRPLLRTHVRQSLRCIMFMWAALSAATDAALAQHQQRPQRLSPSQQEALGDRLNDNTLIVATSHSTASYFAMVHDIAAALGKSGDLRLLPIPGDGGIETLRDLLFLRGVDMAIVPANALAHAKSTGLLGTDLPARIAYITRLYSEEVHLLVGREVKALKDLRGKRVAVAENDGTAQFTSGDLFRRLGLDVETVKMPAAQVPELIRSGKVAAALLLAGKPLPLLAGLPKDGSIRLLGLPFTPALEEGYAPAAFRSDDYSNLIPAGAVIDTVAVNAVLLAQTGRDYEESSQRVARFVPAFFGAMSEHPPLTRHAKWREVNLAATVPGWSRVAAADEWLRRAQQQQTLSLQRSFEEFLRESQPPGSRNLTAAQRKKLFDDFVSWTRKSAGEPDALARR